MTDEQLKTFIKHSNLIEGITDEKEIINSLSAWNQIKDREEIIVDDILLVHYHIMFQLNHRIAGKFRKCEVTVGGRVCVPNWQVPALMSGWIKQYGKGIKTMKEAKEAHVEFEKIHPHQDGNGRTGRLLLLWHRYKAGYPFNYINIRERAEYYTWFK